MFNQLFAPAANPYQGLGRQIGQLDPKGSHIISPIPLDNEYYNNHLKAIEDRANNHVKSQLDKLQAQYEAKNQELELLTNEANEALTFATESAKLNFEWYFDLIFLKSIAMSLELSQAKAKIQAIANEKGEVWQATAEAMYSENEGLRAEIATLKKNVVHIGKSKTIADLKERVRETLK